MLDQNTDRMWYVIGAVLIGAAIIFGMNTLMPEAFASVGDNFSSVVTLVDDKIMHDILGQFKVTEDMMQSAYGAKITVDNESEIITLTTTNSRWTGLTVRPGLVEGYGINRNSKYEITYRLHRMSDDLVNIQNEFWDAGHRNGSIYIDGDKYSLQTNIPLDMDKDYYDIRMVLESTDITPSNVSFVIRPNSGMDDSIVSVEIERLRIKEL